MGWKDPEPVTRVSALEQFPDLSFTDQSVLLADMTGDGLQDFVLVQSGSVSYWPYLGHGAGATQVEVENPPRFPEGYRRDRVQVVDLDGDGCSDIVYFDFDRTLIWVNQAGAFRRSLNRPRSRRSAGLRPPARHRRRPYRYPHLRAVRRGDVLREESQQEWDARLEFSGANGSVFFPFLTGIETREHARQAGASARIERSRYSNYDEHGNLVDRARESFAEGEAPAQWIRSDETYTYTRNAVDWIVKLPVRSELRDAAGVPFAVRITYYDGDPFTGLAEGQVDRGLVTRVQELRLPDSKLPADYIGAHDLVAFGYRHVAGGDTDGWYANTMSVRRDGNGNVLEQRDPLGASLTLAYDADGVYPVSSTDPLGRTTTAAFDPRSGEPATVAYADGRTVRYEHDAVGRLTASFETDDAGVEQLTKRWVLDLASHPVCVTTVSPNSDGRAPNEFTAATDFESLDGVIVSCVYYDGTGSPTLQISTAPDGDGPRPTTHPR